MNYRIFLLSEGAVTIEFGNEISAALNDVVIRLSEKIDLNGFPGLIETVPAYSSLTVFFDVPEVRSSFPAARTAGEAVAAVLEEAVRNLETAVSAIKRVVEIPVRMGGRDGPDLELIATGRGLSPDEFVRIFLERTYRVFMLGFLPGFAYMGEVDERIAFPRRPTPRTRVAKGSIGIAGTQTGIYSLESPGGWQIIGRTSAELFRPDAPEPTLLRAGDEIRFIGEGG